jgi:hypothetical protein
MTRTEWPLWLAGSGLSHTAWSSSTASFAQVSSTAWREADVLGPLAPISPHRHTYDLLHSPTNWILMLD